MKKVAIFTSTRAEYGLLKPVIRLVMDDPELELCLIVTGTHLSAQFGMTCNEILSDGIPICCKIDMDLEDNSPRGSCYSAAKELVGLADFFQNKQPDILVLLGDRYELLPVAFCATLFSVPIAHIHGGELTQGAIDDAIRHAITKLSTLHFPAAKAYAKRILQMGEQPERIFCVGALGVENIHHVELYTRETLADKYSPLFLRDYLIITYHPVTLEKSPIEDQFNALLNYLDKLRDMGLVFTYANADVGGTVINQLIDLFVEQHSDRACAFMSMGQKAYLSALRDCRAVVGNSSSGLLEAPSFKVPTVNIGHRQDGRIRATSVIDCGNSEEEIQRAIETALSKDFAEQCKTTQSPFEGENTSHEIVQRIKDYLVSVTTLKKNFYDLNV
jgi:GDP/UDP-N,N'-diacetylbacillosamine 2-epimerase (hydrolysing)